MKTNDLKKGRYIKLANGWNARLWDNKRGNVRMAEVFGLSRDVGSIYSHNIMQYLDENGTWQDVEHTPAQEKCRGMNASLFGG